MRNKTKWMGLAILAATGLAGCGIMDEMHDIASDTRDHVKISVDEIRGTKTSQNYAFYYENMMGENRPYNTRVDGAKVVLLKAPDDKIGPILALLSSKFDKAAVQIE